jgi:hypothetical protein
MGYLLQTVRDLFGGVAQSGVVLVPGRAGAGQVLPVACAHVEGDGDRGLPEELGWFLGWACNPAAATTRRTQRSFPEWPIAAPDKVSIQQTTAAISSDRGDSRAARAALRGVTQDPGVLGLQLAGARGQFRADFRSEV